jgi:hypothetical protein
VILVNFGPVTTDQCGGPLETIVLHVNDHIGLSQIYVHKNEEGHR